MQVIDVFQKKIGYGDGWAVRCLSSFFGFFKLCIAPEYISC